MKQSPKQPDILEDAIISILAAFVFTIVTKLIKIALLVLRYM